MNEIREIMTKAVVGKGKKTIRLRNNLTPEYEAFSILGCWVINHEFDASLDGTTVNLDGTLEVNVWYSYANNTRTDVARQVFRYHETVKTRQVVKDVSNNKDIIVRVIQQPTCTSAIINNNVVEVEIVFEVIAEVIGETKMVVTVFTNMDSVETIDDNFENEINENFIKEKKIVG